MQYDGGKWLQFVMWPDDVRFGSKADICSAQAHVRFVPLADIQSALTKRKTPGHCQGL